MSSLVFRLRNVPDEEAADVRALLDEAGLDWFETTAGNWSIAMPALWVENDHDRLRARTLIDDYQDARAARLRAERKSAVADGSAPRFIDGLRERPLAVTGVIVFCLFVAWAMIDPFIRLIAQTRG